MRKEDKIFFIRSSKYFWTCISLGRYKIYIPTFSISLWYIVFITRLIWQYEWCTARTITICIYDKSQTNFSEVSKTFYWNSCWQTDHKTKRRYFDARLVITVVVLLLPSFRPRVICSQRATWHGVTEGDLGHGMCHNLYGLVTIILVLFIWITPPPSLSLFLYDIVIKLWIDCNYDSCKDKEEVWLIPISESRT